MPTYEAWSWQQGLRGLLAVKPPADYNNPVAGSLSSFVVQKKKKKKILFNPSTS